MNDLEGFSPLIPLPNPLWKYENWKLRYSSDVDDIVADFYVPALASAKVYDRAVGYFSAHALSYVGRALEPFYDHGASMRLVVSDRLDPQDVRNIEIGYQKRKESQEAAIAATTKQVVLEGQQRPDFRNHIGLLTALIEEGRLEVYIALGRLNPHTAALFHEKIGVVEDHDGNFLTFEGSPNETGSALGPEKNIESFPVHRSWVSGERPHAEAARKAIRGLFLDEDESERNVEVVKFPEAQIEILKKAYEPKPPEGRRIRVRRKKRQDSGDGLQSEQVPMIPDHIELRDYQSEAVRGWIASGGRGRFEMATGTGKTITALAAAVNAVQQCEARGESLLVVVLVPDGPLVAQWSDDAAEFGFNPIASANRGWREEFASHTLLLAHGELSHSLVIATFDAALASKQELAIQITNHRSADGEDSARVLLIADEAHGLGAQTRQALLLDRFDYRLGLTATFKRHFDDEGTELLEEFFAGHRAQVSMHDAIHKYKSLVPYRYHPVLVELSSEETAEYRKLSKEISRLYAMGSDGWEAFENAANVKLLRRAAILKHAAGKIQAVRSVIAELVETKYMLVYTAEGDGPLENSGRQDEALMGVFKSLGVNARTFNGDAPVRQRVFLQGELDQGYCDCLVAMKCLDEGIDIPEARVALFVASTTSPRQYIQRRGRVLRRPKDPSSTKHSADLYDFVVVPPQGDLDDSEFDIERKIVGRELRRAHELAESAENHYQAVDRLSELISRFQLGDQEV